MVDTNYDYENYPTGHDVAGGVADQPPAPPPAPEPDEYADYPTGHDVAGGVADQPIEVDDKGVPYTPEQEMPPEYEPGTDLAGGVADEPERVATIAGKTYDISKVKEPIPIGEFIGSKVDFEKNHIRLPDGKYVAIKDFNELPEQYRSIGIRQGYDAMVSAINQSQSDFDKNHIRLPDGKYVAVSDWNSLPENYQKIGVRQGYDAMRTAMVADKERIDSAYQALQPYRIKEPSAKYEYPQGGAPFEYYEGLEQYDILSALRKGVKPSDIAMFYPPEVVKEAQKINKQIEQTAKVQQVELGRQWRNLETGEVISDAQHRAIKGTLEADKYVRDLPALVLAVDPKWQTLKDRPKTDPERMAYVAKFQQKLLDTANIIGLATLPYTMGAIGAVGKAIQITPKMGSVLARVPVSVYNNVVRTGVLLTKTANLAPVAYTATRGYDEVLAVRLNDDWNKFAKLPESKKNEWAGIAGYQPDYSKLNDEQKAVVLLAYSKPPEQGRETWLKTIGEKSEELIDYAEKGSTWLNNHVSSPLIKPVIFAGGTVVGVIEGMGYVASIPFIASNLSTSVPKGTAPQYAKTVATGMVRFFTQIIPDALRRDPTITAGRLTGLFILSPNALLKLGKGATARARVGKYIPERAMGQEYSVVRINWQKLPEFLTPDLQMQFTSQLEKQLLVGLKYGSIKVGNGVAIVRIRNVPYQRVYGMSLWHATTDIKNFKPEGFNVVKKLYTSPQLALRFAIRSARGDPMANPGVIEVRLPEGFKPQVKKTYKGTIELEHPFGETYKFEPIKGWTGKGVTTDVYTGIMPIQRYTIAGSQALIKHINPANYSRLLALTALETMADLFLGWNGRMRVLKEAFAKGKTKGRQPGLTDWMKAEGELTRLAEILHGRRSAVSYDIRLKDMYNHPFVAELKGEYLKAITDAIKDILRKAKGEKAKLALEYMRQGNLKRAMEVYPDPFKKRLSEVMSKEKWIDMNRKLIEKELKETYDRYGHYIYRPDMYADRYSYWLDRLARIYALPERAIERPPELNTLVREYVIANARERPQTVAPRERAYIPSTVSEIYIPPERPEEREPIETIEERPPEEQPETEIPPEEPIEIEEPPETPPEEPPPPPERPDRERPPTEPPEITTMQGMEKTREYEQPQTIPGGAVTWAQGSRKSYGGRLAPQWYYIPPPYQNKKPISLDAPPIGARYTTSASPYETIQIIGKPNAKVPHKIDVDLGWADITIIDGSTIKFRAGGEDTNVGTGIDSNTVGMDIDEWNTTELVHTHKPTTRRRRTKANRKTPVYINSMQGVSRG